MDPTAVLRNLAEANIDEETALWIYDLMDNYMEFLRLKNEKGLRSFVARLRTGFLLRYQRLCPGGAPGHRHPRSEAFGEHHLCGIRHQEGTHHGL